MLTAYYMLEHPLISQAVKFGVIRAKAKSGLIKQARQEAGLVTRCKTLLDTDDKVVLKSCRLDQQLTISITPNAANEFIDAQILHRTDILGARVSLIYNLTVFQVYGDDETSYLEVYKNGELLFKGNIGCNKFTYTSMGAFPGGNIAIGSAAIPQRNRRLIKDILC